MKRSNGSGSVVKLSGNRRRPYAVRVSSRDPHGHITQHTLSYHAKVQEAQAALEEYNRQRTAGTAPSPDKLSITVQQVYDAWSQREYQKMSSACMYSYRAAWKRLSKFASRPFRDITLDEWQSILDEAESSGKSQSTINNAATLIRFLFSYCTKRDIVGKDYSKFLDIPSVNPLKSRGILTDLQLHQLQQMADSGVPWADSVLILCYTGFRIQEFLSLTRFSYHEEDNGYFVGGVKTEAGRDRIVPIHPKIMPYVQSHLSQHGETIFCDSDGRRMSYTHYRIIFDQLMQDIGASNVTPHWCRHTFATRLHAANADELAMKWLLGHSTKGDVTATYIHQTIPLLRDAILLLA